MTNKITTEKFIEKAKKMHGNKFDYSYTIYVNAKTKIKIKCPKHGIFELLPRDHIRDDKRQRSKGGCKKCSSVFKHTTESFIQKAHQVHGEDQ
jgi:hypothetical protein